MKRFAECKADVGKRRIALVDFYFLNSASSLAVTDLAVPGVGTASQTHEV